MNQAGVWSFRTTTGVARVVNGSLQQRHTLHGFVFGTRRRLDSGSLLKSISVGIGTIGTMEPVRGVIDAVVFNGSGSVGSIGLAALLSSVGMLVLFSLPVWSILRPSEQVDIYDITGVTVDSEGCELTVQYDDGETDETTTVEVYDEDELKTAIEILRLKGTQVIE